MEGPIRNPIIPDYTIGSIISGILGVVLLFAAFLSFAYIIVGGYQWMASGGDKERIETARNRIMQAVVGLLIIASVWAIIKVVFPLVGLSFPMIDIPSIGRGLDL